MGGLMKLRLLILLGGLVLVGCERQHDKDEKQTVPGTASILRSGGDVAYGDLK